LASQEDAVAFSALAQTEVGQIERALYTQHASMILSAAKQRKEVDETLAVIHRSHRSEDIYRYTIAFDAIFNPVFGKHVDSFSWELAGAWVVHIWQNSDYFVECAHCAMSAFLQRCPDEEGEWSSAPVEVLQRMVVKTGYKAPEVLAGLSPASRQNAYDFYRARMYLLAKEYDAAFLLAQNLISRMPHNSDAILLLLETAYESHNFRAAADLALQLDPEMLSGDEPIDNLEFDIFVMRSLIGAGDYQGAEKHYEQFLGDKKDFGDVHDPIMDAVFKFTVMQKKYDKAKEIAHDWLAQECWECKDHDDREVLAEFLNLLDDLPVGGLAAEEKLHAFVTGRNDEYYHFYDFRFRR